jgi:hypothetical protein
MGIFGKRGQGGDNDLAKIIAKRGVPAEAIIVRLTPTGRARDGDVAREFEFELALTVAGQAYRPVVRQFMNDLTMTGLAAGEPVQVMYDQQDPATLIVMQSPKYVFVRNPNAAFDGSPMRAIPVAEAGHPPQD